MALPDSWRCHAPSLRAQRKPCPFSASRTSAGGIASKENLQTVVVAVGNHLAALKLPALETDLPILCQRFQPLFDAVDFLIVVGKDIGRIWCGFP